MQKMRKLYCLILLVLSVVGGVSAQPVRQLRITILSTMLTDTIGKGEWGFSALVEADGHKMLFDAGTDSTLVLSNAREWGIDCIAQCFSGDPSDGVRHHLRRGGLLPEPL